MKLDCYQIEYIEFFSHSLINISLILIDSNYFSVNKYLYDSLLLKSFKKFQFNRIFDVICTLNGSVYKKSRREKEVFKLLLLKCIK